MLQKLSHPNLVKMVGYNPDTSELTMCNHGKTIAQTRMEPVEIIQLLQQMVAVLEYMHQVGVVHSDVKPDNIVVKNTPVEGKLFTLIDLGSCVDFTEQITLDSYTMIYTAPEILSGATIIEPEKIDVWSLGVTLLECATGTNPFAAATKSAILRNIFNTLVVTAETAERFGMTAFTKRGYNSRPLLQDFHTRYETNPDRINFSNHLRNLVVDMLAVQPEKRPTLKQLQATPCYQWLVQWVAQ